MGYTVFLVGKAGGRAHLFSLQISKIKFKWKVVQINILENISFLCLKISHDIQHTIYGPDPGWKMDVIEPANQNKNLGWLNDYTIIVILETENYKLMLWLLIL